MVTPALAQASSDSSPGEPGAGIIRENTYGSLKRLKWMSRFLSGTVLEFGCGTGAMITLPLALSGYDACGVDLDAKSIECGRSIFERHRVPSTRLQCIDLRDVASTFDVIIASEVLEHIPDAIQDDVLRLLHGKLSSDGTLIVTVPNGYGWFELESFLWNKMKIGRLVEGLRLTKLSLALKRALTGSFGENPYPNTLADADSPHVQRFTWTSIQALLARHGFQVIGATGSVMFAGPFSNMLLTGFVPLMRLNAKLGDLLPRHASGFYFACRKTGAS